MRDNMNEGDDTMRDNMNEGDDTMRDNLSGGDDTMRESVDDCVMCTLCMHTHMHNRVF